MVFKFLYVFFKKVLFYVNARPSKIRMKYFGSFTILVGYVRATCVKNVISIVHNNLCLKSSILSIFKNAKQKKNNSNIKSTLILAVKNCLSKVFYLVSFGFIFCMTLQFDHYLVLDVRIGPFCMDFMSQREI